MTEETVSMPSLNKSVCVARTKQRQQLLDNIRAIVDAPELCMSMSSHQLEVKLSILERQWDTFESLQSSIELLDVTEFENPFRENFESLYYQAKVMLKEKLALLHIRDADTTLSSTRIQAAPNRRVQLPSIQLTKFDGSEGEWLDFFNLFNVLVNSNDDLSNIEKFQYLRSCLTGNAARLIQSLEVTSYNYEKAIELLKARYENRRYIFMSHLNSIFDAQKLTKSNASATRELIDSINVNLRAMQSIATAQQIADGILLHLVTSKLDTNTLAKWEEEVSSSCDSTGASSLTLPSWNDLAKFLERRCKIMSMMDNTPTPNKLLQAVSQGRAYPSKGQFRSAFVTSSPQASQNCILCQTTPYHNAFKCVQFMKMTTNDRFYLVKRLNLYINCLGMGHHCKECPSSHRCQHCAASHHTLLHNSQSNNVPERVEEAVDDPERASLLSSSTALQVSHENNEVLLGTALINVSNVLGISTQGRALLDSASQLNFISERLAQHLNISRKRANFEITGIGMTSTQTCQVGTVNIASNQGDFSAKVDVVIIPSITSNQPQRKLDTTAWIIPKTLNLADKSFSIPGRIDILIGAGLFYDILLSNQIKLNGLTIQQTKLGWIVVGEIPIRTALDKRSRSTLHTSSLAPYTTFNTISTNPTIEDLMQKFWMIEDNVAPASLLSAEHLEWEKHFSKTIQRCPQSGKYIVRLPLKAELSSLGDSYQVALKRMRSLEVKLAQNPSLQKDYTDFMNEYINMGHMTSVISDETVSKELNYIPHHCVLKLDSSTTKLRVVFDASCRSSNGKSLNDILRVGPTIQDDVFTIILRFRKHRYVVMADITKMYRQILLDPADTKYQCILWRSTQNEPMTTYRLQTVTYGTSCAPYLATKCLQQLSRDYSKEFPTGSRVTERDFYVDNLLTGGSSINEVINIKSEVTALLKLGGFPRKFAANHSSIIADVPEGDREEIIRLHDTEYIKTLGLKWSPQEDTFIFGIHHAEQSLLTKRKILSQTASIFDPLGLLNPLVVTCKILLQNLWKSHLQWDDPVPKEIQLHWHKIQKEFSEIHHLKIPRFLEINHDTQIHIFADASIKAYGACAYAVTSTGNKRCSTLVCAKSRVAPLRDVTLPRLELCAALLAAKLTKSIVKTLPVTPSNIFYWSDSTITLAWIASDPCRWNVFVSNRIAEIQSLTTGSKWLHVPTNENPADLVSRGATLKDLIKKSFWLNGPQYLLSEPQHWPPSPHLTDTDTEVPEVRKNRTTLLAHKAVDMLIDLKYINNYKATLRIFAYIYRFFQRLRKIKDTPNTLQVSSEEMDSALHGICMHLQQVSCPNEYKAIAANQSLRPQSSLSQLSPFMHNGLIRTIPLFAPSLNIITGTTFMQELKH